MINSILAINHCSPFPRASQKAQFRVAKSDTPKVLLAELSGDVDGSSLELKAVKCSND